MRAILDVILIALDFYIYVLIAAAVMSWLLAFNVINGRNGFVATLMNVIYQMTEPLLRPIRRLLPNMGGLDLSPLVLLLGIILVQRLIIYYVYPSVF